MLSLDRHRKRKSIQRQRSRLISPTFGTVPHCVPIEQLPFPENVSLPPHNSANNMFYPASSSATYSGKSFLSSSATLSDRLPIAETMVDNVQETGAFLNPMHFSQFSYKKREVQQTEKIATMVTKNVVPLRGPIVIFGNGKKSTGISYPPRGRRIVVHGAVSILLLFIVTSALVVVVPVGDDGREGVSVFQPLVTMISGRKNETALITAENATATAVTVDGYDPGNVHFVGVMSIPANLHVPAADYGSLNRFFYGQCTFWANMRYHQLTGHWIPWLGDAYEWAYQAPAYGWTISNIPNPHGHSIMVFSPYALGSGPYGHVAVVEKVNPDGSVLTSNWNWNGMWATQSWMTFYPNHAVSFIWYPN